MTNCYDRQGNPITVPEMMDLVSEAFDRGEWVAA